MAAFRKTGTFPFISHDGIAISARGLPVRSRAANTIDDSHLGSERYFVMTSTS
jgi:hypothetical protein